MRISTYNIWDSDRGMPDRFSQILNEIKSNNADILCLQEVFDYSSFDKICEVGNYDEAYFHENYGVAVFSKFPVSNVYKTEYGIAIKAEVDGRSYLIMNVHLPWKIASKREELIVDIVDSSKDIDADYTIITGDFNCSVNSSVHRYLKGDQSLLESDAYFVDLAEAFAEIQGTVPDATLNVRENPRYKNAEGISTNTIEINQRYDRILLKNPFPKDYPSLKMFGIFGTEISPITNLCASDHYGVFADLEIDLI